MAMDLKHAAGVLAVVLATTATVTLVVSGQMSIENDTNWTTYSDNLTDANTTEYPRYYPNVTHYNESMRAAMAHATRMEKAREWSDPGSYAILVISEVGQTFASDAIGILSEYLMKVRGDELGIFYVELESTTNDTEVLRQEICNQLRNARTTRPLPRDRTGILINAIIDTTESPALSQQVSDAMAPFGLPTFAITSTTVKPVRNKLDARINFSSLANYMAVSARYIIGKEKLSTAALYYDRQFDPERVRRPITPGHSLSLNNATTRHSVREIDAATPERAAAQLKRAVNDNIYNWFLFTNNMQTAETFLLEAERAQRTKPGKFSWFVISSGDVEFECRECEEARVNVFRPVPANEDEAENVLKFFTHEAAKILNETYGIGNISTSRSSSSSRDNGVQWRLGSKLNGTMSTSILYYYDMLSASVKMIKRLEAVDEMKTADIVELVCSPPPPPVEMEIEIGGGNSTDGQNTTQSLEPEMTRLAFNMTEIAEETEYVGVLGFVSLVKIPLSFAADSKRLDLQALAEAMNNHTVYIQAPVRITQYNFKEELVLGVVGKADYLGVLAHNDNGNINLTETPKIKRVTPWGTWTPTRYGIRLDPGAPKYYMSRKLYTVAFIEMLPFAFRNKTGWSGFIPDVMMEMSNQLGFDYIMDEPVPDNIGGSYNPDSGKWSGMIRELVEKRADLALGPLEVTSEREDYVDFTLPIFDLNGIAILIKKNKDVASMFKFVGVFSDAVWYCCGGVFVFISIMIWIYDFFSPYSQRNIMRRRAGKSMQIGPSIVQILRRRRQKHRRSPDNFFKVLVRNFRKLTAVVGLADDITNKKLQQQQQTVATVDRADMKHVPDDDEDEDEHEDEQGDGTQRAEPVYGSRVFSLKESFWFTLSTLTPQGGGDAPRNLSGRLMAVSWWIFVFIIVATYTANLAAFLTVSKLDSPIMGLDDLMRQSGIRYAPHENSEAEQYFRRMALIEDKFYEIWSGLVLNESLTNREQLMYSTYEYPIRDKYTNLFLTFQANEKPKDFWDGVRWVKNSISTRNGFALIADEAMIRYAIAHDENCDLKLLGGEWSRKPYSIATQDDSPLKEELSGVILDLLNDRVLEIYMYKENWWEEVNTKCYNTEEADFMLKAAGISLDNVGGVFAVIAFGTLTASSMLGLEVYWYRWRAEEKADVLATSRTARILGRLFGGLEKAIEDARRREREQNEKTAVRDMYKSEFGMCKNGF